MKRSGLWTVFFRGMSYSEIAYIADVLQHRPIFQVNWVSQCFRQVANSVLLQEEGLQHSVRREVENRFCVWQFR